MTTRAGGDMPKFRSRIGRILNEDLAAGRCCQDGICPKHQRIDAQVRFASSRHAYLDDPTTGNEDAMRTWAQAYSIAVDREKKEGE